MDRPNNPLLERESLPRFDQIRPEHVGPGMQAVLAEARDLLESVEGRAGPTWDSLFEPFESLAPLFENSWGALCHLLNVKNTPELRDAHAEVQPQVVAFSLKCRQSEKLYRLTKELAGSPAFAELDPARQRAVTLRLHEAEDAGVALGGADRERFNAIEQELSALKTKFSNNLLDSTKAFSMTVEEGPDTEGWPQSLREMAAGAYARQNQTDADPKRGPFLVTLDFPVYSAFMRHSRNAAHREKVYKAYSTRASTGDVDNTPLMRRILALRREQAMLLGFDNYAAWNLARNMAGTPERALSMLKQLAAPAKPAAAAELREILTLAGKDRWICGTSVSTRSVCARSCSITATTICGPTSH